MGRTMSVFICFLIQISISKTWSSTLFPCVPGSFRTFSSSPSNGPFFISTLPYLMFTPNVINMPVKLSPEENCTSQPDVNKLIAQEAAGIEEEDIITDEEDPITDIETTLAEENEMKINETLFENKPVLSKENIERTENIENSKNISPIGDTPV